MRKCTFILLFLILTFGISACSNEERVSLEPILDRSTIDIDWTMGLEKGVYLKKISTTEGILYVNLNSGESLYTSIDASVKYSGAKVKIIINEVDAVQDTEVSYEYFGRLTSNKGLDELEVYLNEKKVNIIVIQ